MPGDTRGGPCRPQNPYGCFLHPAPSAAPVFLRSVPMDFVGKTSSLHLAASARASCVRASTVPKGQRVPMQPYKGHGPLRSADSPPKLNPPGAETSCAYHRGPSPSSEEESALPKAGPAAGPSPRQRMPGDVTHLLLVGHRHLRLQHLLMPLLVLAQQPEVTSHCSSVASAGQEKSPGARGTLETPSLLGAGLRLSLG